MKRRQCDLAAATPWAQIALPIGAVPVRHTSAGAFPLLLHACCAAVRWGGVRGRRAMTIRTSCFAPAPRVRCRRMHRAAGQPSQGPPSHSAPPLATSWAMRAGAIDRMRRRKRTQNRATGCRRSLDGVCAGSARRARRSAPIEQSAPRPFAGQKPDLRRRGAGRRSFISGTCKCIAQWLERLAADWQVPG